MVSRNEMGGLGSHKGGMEVLELSTQYGGEGVRLVQRFTSNAERFVLRKGEVHRKAWSFNRTFPSLHSFYSELAAFIRARVIKVF